MSEHSHECTLRHSEDRSPLNIIVNNDGVMLVACKACKRLWSGQLQVEEWPEKVKVRGRNNILNSFDEDMVRSLVE